MKLKEVLNREKQNLPTYQYKFNYYFILPCVITIFLLGIIGAVLTPTLWVQFPNSFIPFIPLIIWFCLFVAFLITAATVGGKLRKRLIADKTAELEQQFVTQDDQAVIAALQDKQIATEQGFYIYDLEQFGFADGETLPFDEYQPILPLRDTLLIFFARYFSGIVFLQMGVIDQKSGELIAVPVLNSSLYNYIAKHNFPVINKEIYDVFLTSKEQFIVNLLRYGDTDKWGRKLYGDV